VAVRLLLALLLFLASLPVQPAGALDRSEGRQWHAAHPDWLLPAWTADGPAAWTMVGQPYASSVTLVGADGSFAPRNHGPSVSVWLYDLDNERLINPADHAPGFQLDEDALPIVTTSWSADDVQLVSTYFTAAPGVTYLRMTLSTSSSAGRHFDAYVALRPFGVEPDMHPIERASCDAGAASLAADGKPLLVGLQPADSCGATDLASGDISTFAVTDRLPRRAEVSDPAKRAEATLRLSVTPSAGHPSWLEFRMPMLDGLASDTLRGGGESFDAQRADVAGAWKPVLSRVTLDVPDPRLKDAFRASQAYLLLNRTPNNLPRSGPLAHDAFWVRDAAYVGEALERIGAGADNQATLDKLLAIQRDDGSLPAITDANGPRSVDEWDAPGEAIAALVSHYRFSRDRAWLANSYPTIVHAAGFLDALRGRTDDTLMPPNMSAEDLGSASWRHYWDDLWAIAGYREAAFAAAELGFSEDAAAFSARGDDLEAALVRSVQDVQQATGKVFIPNGPEDVLSSAMARGTTPALWPVRALKSDAALDLLGPSFTNYYSAWLAPQGGGYLHYQGTLWPYGGLGIAHAMLRLGMRDQVRQVLEWTINHQTVPGAYAWGEAINPSNGGLELGDMPHSWAAAELISLLRDMVLAEEDGWLLVGDGVPDAWLAPGRRVALLNAPTHYGTVNVSMARPSASELRLQLDGAPPRGFRVRLPGAPLSVRVDGLATPLSSDGQLRLAPSAREVVVRYAEPAS
jgi:hypothetical protein